jgi:hypothetical protein
MDTTSTVPVACRCGHPHFTARVVVEINREQQPVAGKTFQGLTFRYIGPATISWVECDAKIAGKRLPARQQSFFAPSRHRNMVICRWRIPAHAGGERLRLWTYESGGRARAWVVHAWPHLVATGHLGSTSWLVKK